MTWHTEGTSKNHPLEDKLMVGPHFHALNSSLATCSVWICSVSGALRIHLPCCGENGQIQSKVLTSHLVLVDRMIQRLELTCEGLGRLKKIPSLVLCIKGHTHNGLHKCTHAHIHTHKCVCMHVRVYALCLEKLSSRGL